MSYYLAIVSPLDTPLYELSFTSPSSSSSSSKPSQSSSTSSFPSWSSFTTSSGGDVNSATPATTNGASTGTGGGAALGANLGLVQNQGGPALERHLAQMVAFAALDSVEEVLEGTGNLYLKSVDRHNQWIVSAFIATSVKFVLLHDQKNDDGIRQFFLDLWELYVKASLNPFHTVNTPIRSPAFDARVRSVVKKSL